jgi:hypothetical protein
LTTPVNSVVIGVERGDDEVIASCASLAVAALVLGIIGALASLIPLLFFIAFPLG